MNELVERNVESLENNLVESNDSFCSFTADTPEDKAKLFRIMNSPAKRISDCINETIVVKDVYCEKVQVINKETGAISTCPRVVLVDEKGIGYQCVSFGVFGSLKKLFQVYGVPTWEPGIPVKVKQITRDKNKILTLTI